MGRRVMPDSWRSCFRLLSAVIPLAALVFFVGLAMTLGEAGGLKAFASAVVSSARFTKDYLSSLVEGYPASADVTRALPRSLGLLAAALTLALLIGLPLGIASALRRHSPLSSLLVHLSVVGISTPSFFAAMLLVWLSVWLYRVYEIDFLPVYGFGWDAHLILPALVLATRPAASVMRLGHNALLEVLEADHVRTAHAKGLGPWVVLMRHVLRNAGVPILTTVAVSLRSSLAILPIVEYIFNWSGVGQGLLEALRAQDPVLAVSMLLPLAMVFVLVSMLLEGLYLLVDPRLRVREGGSA